jgi:hypothetical protein
MMRCDKLLVVQQKYNVTFSEECYLENRTIVSRNRSGIFPLYRIGASKLVMAKGHTRYCGLVRRSHE